VVSAATISNVKDVAVDIVGGIPGATVSFGVSGITILVCGDPVMTISPVGGGFLVKALRSLDARLSGSGSTAQARLTGESDWEGFLTSKVSDVYRSLHLAEPRLRWRAGTAERLEQELTGRGKPLSQSNHAYWLLLADWLEGSGALPNSRVATKWARLYAKRLAEKRPCSERFAAWALRVSEKARAAGFRPIVARIQEARVEQPAATPEAADVQPNREGLPGACAAIRDRVRTVDGPTADVIRCNGDTNTPELVAARAAVIRVLAHSIRRAIREELRIAASDSPAAAILPINGWLPAAIDAADAVAAGDAISKDHQLVLEGRWRRATNPCS